MYLRAYYVVGVHEDGQWYCTCAFGLKHLICKHLVKVVVLFFGSKLPDSLRVQRQSGRQAKVSKALCRR